MNVVTSLGVGHEAYNKQLWKVDVDGDERKVTYLSSLEKHTQAVNVVRWCPRGTSPLSQPRSRLTSASRRAAGQC